MNESITNLALLVHACDRYEFLYKGFGYFFSKHWDYSIPCNYYFATEEKHMAIPGFTNIRSGKGEWSDRLRILLSEAIQEEYVLYFQEDVWLNKDVNGAFIKQLLELATMHKWDQVKLHSSEVYKTKATDIFIEGFNISILDNATSDFLMSHQVTLWRKDFLIGQLLKNEHPWRNERKGTKRLRNLNAVIHHADLFAEDGRKPINNNKPEAKRSEYFAISRNGMLEGSILIYIDKLMSGNKEQQDYAQALLHHYNNKLTHDGKARPRKDDIFKKMKNLIKGKLYRR
jgi:hypothetical protein